MSTKRKFGTKIVINGRFATSEHPTGTHRASRDFATTICRMDSNAELVAPRTAKIAELEIQSKKTIGPWRINHHIWEQVVFPFYKRNHLHLSLMGTGPAIFYTSRSLMFVHDTNFLLLKNTFSRSFVIFYKFAMLFAARRALHIFVNSEYTKTSLIKLGVEPEKVTVTYLGTGINKDLLATQQSLEDYSFLEAKRYLLCVGALQPHKNLKSVLKAYTLLRQTDTELLLVVVGKKQEKFLDAGIEQAQYQQDGIVFTGYIEDRTLASLYQNAQAFIYVSLEEGFGLPIVEAFHASCPVITSDQSCMPEISAGAAKLVAPTDIQGIAKAASEIMQDQSVREGMIAEGRRVARKYDWELAAKIIINKIKSIVH